MNIKQAKQEIINMVQAYLTKDETGEYAIPVERQRPVLLIGPPGIGKTAIMEQVARECNINLVSYTITHHTRQSAIGLPFISHKRYDGKEYAVTEYTMSEIVASIYNKIEEIINVLYDNSMIDKLSLAIYFFVYRYYEYLLFTSHYYKVNCVMSSSDFIKAIYKLINKIKIQQIFNKRFASACTNDRWEKLKMQNKNIVRLFLFI